MADSKKQIAQIDAETKDMDKKNKRLERRIKDAKTMIDKGWDTGPSQVEKLKEDVKGEWYQYKNKDLPLRAKGGPVKKGKKYVVGEKGPELFNPKEDGKIISHKQSKKIIAKSKVAKKKK